MRFFNRKPVSTPDEKRLTDDWSLDANGMLTTYGEMRFHAANVAKRDYRNQVEQGLALSIVSIIDDIEQRAKTGGYS